MNKKDNIVIFATYLAQSNKKDDIIKFSDLSLAKTKFYEIEKLNDYRYLELGIDNVKSPTEGTYDILETYKIFDLKEIIEDRYEKFYDNLTKDIKKELQINEKLSKFDSNDRKIVRDLIKFILEGNLSKTLEDNLPSDLLKFKNFKFKQLFNESELNILSSVEIDLNKPYNADKNELVKGVISMFKLKNNEIIEIL